MSQASTQIQRRETAEMYLGRKMKALAIDEGHIKGVPTDRKNGPGWDRSIEDVLLQSIDGEWRHTTDIKRRSGQKSNKVTQILLRMANEGKIQCKRARYQRRGMISLYRSWPTGSFD